jgi:hypothetical protein
VAKNFQSFVQEQVSAGEDRVPVYRFQNLTAVAVEPGCAIADFFPGSRYLSARRLVMRDTDIWGSRGMLVFKLGYDHSLSRNTRLASQYSE